MVKVTSGLHQSIGVSRVYYNSKLRYMYQTTVVFGTLTNARPLIDSLASNN